MAPNTAPTTFAMVPSTVFFGEIEGANGCLPKYLPISIAALSPAHTGKVTSKMGVRQSKRSCDMSPRCSITAEAMGAAIHNGANSSAQNPFHNRAETKTPSEKGSNKANWATARYSVGQRTPANAATKMMPTNGMRRQPLKTDNS